MFQLSKDEWQNISSQIVMTSIVKRPKSAIPYAFTEHGVSMLANVLKSKKARTTSVSIIRAFITLKQFLSQYSDLSQKLLELECKYDKQFSDIFEALNYLLQKDTIEKEQKERRVIGYGR